MKEKVLPVVPSPVTVNTGDEAGPHHVGQEFFTAVLSFLGYEGKATECFTQQEFYDLTDFAPSQPITTANGIILLVVRDVVVASSLFWRNELNRVCILYAHYLTDEVIERVRWKEPED